MKRFLTLNVLFFITFSVVLLSMGYSLHRLKIAFTANILERYTQEIGSDVIQLQMNLQTMVNENNTDTLQTLPNLLVRFVNIHPITKRIQVYMHGKPVADTSYRPLKLSETFRRRCPKITELDARSIEAGHFCYKVPLRIYRRGKRVPAELYIILDREKLTTQLDHELQQMMIPVILIMGIVIAITALLFWGTIIRNFSRLLRWSDDPIQDPPHFLIVEFAKISEKIHRFAKRLAQQFDLLKAAMDRESNLRAIMQTITWINELMVTEKDAEIFLQKACDILSSYRSYFATSIFLLTDDGIEPAISVIAIDDSDTDGGTVICIGHDELERLKEEGATHLIRKTHDAEACRHDHAEIFFPQKIDEAWVGIFPLRYDTDRPPLGYLIVNTLETSGFDNEEIEMLVELAGDIGFAIHAFRREKEMEAMLFTHPLTGLPNAAAFNARAERYRGDYLVMANIDRFKSVNTLYGIKVADEILKQFAGLLRRLLPTDVRIFHHIGDEFILLFPAETEKLELERTLQGLLQRIESHIFSYHDIEALLSVRFGITVLKDELSIRECHMALLEAKQTRNPIQWYTPDLNAMVKDDMIQIYRTLKSAIESDRVINYYQGIYSPEQGEFLHYEALVRIRQEDGTILSPAAFVDFAKQTRLYPRMTARIFESALIAIEKLQRPVTINLSSVDILDKQFRQTLYRRLEQNPPPHPVVFEILESENIENYETTAEFVRTVKSFGCKVAIDDFGTGYANFQHIAKLDADILKIDGSLIKNILHDTQTRAIVKNINQIAHDLGMTTVAEFVSSEEIYHAARALGIDTMQGFYFHRPQPLEEILRDHGSPRSPKV